MAARRFYNRIRVGVAGWSYDDWRGTLYPSPTPRGFDPLHYLSGYLDLVEINTTFYRPPKAEHARRWAERVADRADFRFTAKLWRRFTHDRSESRTRDEADAVREGLAPLVEAERLDALLLQFPWSFRNDEAGREWLADVRIDQPRFSRSVAPSARATARIGYVRVHGRNYRDWFRKGAGRGARYDYLYTAAELGAWAERAKEVARGDEVDTVDVVFNNHYKAQAVVNALEFRKVLGDPHVQAPGPLAAAYPGEIREHGIPVAEAA